MKAILLILFTLSFCEITFAQKCKFDYEDIDIITNKVMRAVKAEQINKSASILQEGSDYFIKLSFNTIGIRREIFKTGDTLFVKLNDGNLIHLFCYQDVAPVNQVGNMGGSTFYKVIYFIPKDILNKLAQSRIILFRLKVSGTSYDLDFNERGMEKLRVAADCFTKG